MQLVRIKYINDKCKPEKIKVGDWIDLKAAATIELKKGDYYQIPLGIAMEFDHNYEAYIAPRSSTFKKYGIIQTNGWGVVDSSYCGDTDEWQMPVYATRDTVIHEGDRIAQFRVVPSQEGVVFIETDKLGNPERGGFGSTGTN